MFLKQFQIFNYLKNFYVCILLDTKLISVYYDSMIQAYQINSVSKNNFLSLMKSYEKNYYSIKNLVDLEILNIKSIGKKFQSKPGKSKEKLLLSVCTISKHTAEIKFSYNFFSKDVYVNYVDLKIYFDSKQVEIIESKNFKQKQYLKDMQTFHNIRLSKWYKSYFLSLWLNSCIKNGYSFDAQSEV